MKIFFILSFLFLNSCAAPMTKKLNRISVGMTKKEVINEMGNPDSVSAAKGVEFLNYRLATSFLDTDGSDTSDYFVKIVNGRVDSYGKRGDMGSTEPETRKIIIKKEE